jgi:LysM repeat protein
VRWGDTLNSISYRTGVSPWAIAQANGIYNLNRIYAGQALWIPCP